MLSAASVTKPAWFSSSASRATLHHRQQKSPVATVACCQLHRSSDAPLDRRSLLAAGATTLLSVLAAQKACAEDSLPAEVAPTPAPAVEKIYFGSGCFWGRQKDFVDTELALGRLPSTISATVGYAGGPYTASDGRVCYYYAPPETEYERLGHAEVVGLELRGSPAEKEMQLREFATLYFQQFRPSPFGMQRQDPQDEGPGYRNMIGIPGGMESPFMKIIADANVNRMEMVEGKGNLFGRNGSASEDDVVNLVYVMDSDKFAFHPAEVYHQFHNGLGKEFPKAYTRDLKAIALNSGIIKETGCPENPFGIRMSPF